MCGITGWIDWNEDLTAKGPVLLEMAGTLANRGPDAGGIWLSPHAALAHRRLIVVDPAGGGQPMLRRRGERTCVLVYNGELYNTSELRQELAAHGYSFQGHSDTEVLLLSFIHWGPDCVERLNGIFAFAVWDDATQSLFMARDRLGVKPLFYTRRGRALIFGSEIKALLAHPAVPPEVDATGLAEIFVLGPARTPGFGVFRGIEELKPGHCLHFDHKGIRIKQYWALQSRPHPHTLYETAVHVRELFQDTVERQLVSDVPISVLLSGGLDSSAITAFAALARRRENKGAINTFSVDYVDNEQHFRPNEFQPNSDAPWIRIMSEHFGTNHHQIIIDTPRLVEALTGAMRARDLPGMADVDSSLYLFSHEIKKEATVALSGESADEIFGGYPWFRRAEDVNGHTFPWVRMVGERARLLAPELRDYIRPEEYVAGRYQEALAEVPRLPGEDPLEAHMRELIYLNMTRFMPILLDRKDRMSMAAGLEVRVPFCDHRLVEYVWNIPWSMKSCDGMEKGILRRAMTGLLPEGILQRRKSPYPKTHHPAYLAAVRAQMENITNDPGSPLLPLVDTGALREVIGDNAAAFSPAWFSQLMGSAQLFAYLIQVDAWLREYHVIIR
ncbi:asparagine synthase (glutamine-hydrolyzing) [Desulfotomaculum copahuensis]|uniref:asparagine synthase (glutamine-hydrolyzing) n=1 Tax=Desulfotomaculum copahuensis TaxID=1838280 RepID=A0A1B7LBS4_9FIRM|nr:asparagine synthase (glutamine-hydrolyzing) [Desulfotomaculum copahuensis]OAT79976.1 asparagine synthase (glutamine-hydrolyzing) [Desulfotomaculum copahuensis]